MVDDAARTAAAEVEVDLSPRWRISKACQECRRRKIRCDGGEPCQHCKQRHSECTYRGFVRQRKRKHELVSQSPGAGEEDEDGVSPRLDHPTGMATMSATGSGRNIVQPHSVTATHVASPSCVVQLYYGPTSNFSLMQLMYRQLVEGMGADDTGSQREIRGGSGSGSGGDEAEEVGPGLDLFSHRRLYFGDLAGNQNLAVSSLADSSPLVFLHPSTASRYLERYLSTTYYLMPFVSKDTYRRRLEQLYDGTRSMSLESPDVTIMLLVLANGAAMLEEEQRAESLFKKARANAATFDELVNIQAIQVPLIMISFTLHQFCVRASFN